MISRGDLKFNCCESVLIRIDGVIPLPGFDPNVMRIASAFGGGVGGWGSVCGAASGAAMAYGLIHGSEGNETYDDYQEKRKHTRDRIQEFMAAFEGEFGTVKCLDLLGVDFRTEEGRKRYEELRKQGVFRCQEYVEWTSEKTIELLENA